MLSSVYIVVLNNKIENLGFNIGRLRLFLYEFYISIKYMNDENDNFTNLFNSKKLFFHEILLRTIKSLQFKKSLELAIN